MGFFKKLKKKLKFKDFLKGVKTISGFVPGGNLIAQGIKVAEDQYKSMKKSLEKKVEKTVKEMPETKPVKKNQGLIPLIGAAVVGFFLMNK